MKVVNTIKLLEINGEKAGKVGDDRRLVIESHWNYSDRIHIKYGDIDLLVPAGDLERAITNAKNHSR